MYAITNRDAGYADSEEAAAALGSTVEALAADLLVERVTPGTLHDYRTGEALREATAAELAASVAAAETDGGTGAIEVEIDGEIVVCYVVE